MDRWRAFLDAEDRSPQDGVIVDLLAGVGRWLDDIGEAPAADHIEDVMVRMFFAGRRPMTPNAVRDRWRSGQRGRHADVSLMLDLGGTLPDGEEPSYHYASHTI